MSNYVQTITLEEARRIAEEVAFRRLNPFLKEGIADVLENNFSEAECCWFFFKNKQIEYPPEYDLSCGRAYAVSKKGELRIIADFSDSPDKLNEYLKVMSEHFKKENI